MGKTDIIIKGYAACISFCLLLLLSDCTRRPKEILDEKEMVSLMADLQLAEAYSNTKVSHDANDDRYSLARSVLAAHGVSQEQLDTTLGWYGKNLDEYVELYAKVDKELLKRKKRLMKVDQVAGPSDGMNLWPYAQNGMLSPLSYSDGWIISIIDPEIEKGDRIVWSMRLSESADLTAVLGVEYTDGSGESTNMNRGRNERVEISLQTDSAKTVSRLYGSIRIKNNKILPLFSDSIKLERLQLDSLEYNISRSQKRYAKPVVVIREKIKENKDSLKKEDLKIKDSSSIKEEQETESISESKTNKSKPKIVGNQPLKMERPSHNTI